MVLKVLRVIAGDITESGYYSIMADESTNASNIEQLVIFTYCVDKETTVCEEYIGQMPATQISFASKMCCCI